MISNKVPLEVKWNKWSYRKISNDNTNDNFYIHYTGIDKNDSRWGRDFQGKCLILWKFFFISFEGLYSERIHLKFIPTCGTIFNVVVSCLAVKCNCPECCLDMNNSFILKNINIRSSGLSTGCLKNKCDLYSRLILKF